MIISCVNPACREEVRLLHTGKFHPLEQPFTNTEFFSLCCACTPKVDLHLDPSRCVSIRPRSDINRSQPPHPERHLRRCRPQPDEGRDGQYRHPTSGRPGPPLDVAQNRPQQNLAKSLALPRLRDARHIRAVFSSLSRPAEETTDAAAPASSRFHPSSSFAFAVQCFQRLQHFFGPL
jgi:hypothetical protein